MRVSVPSFSRPFPNACAANATAVIDARVFGREFVAIQTMGLSAIARPRGSHTSKTTLCDRIPHVVHLAAEKQVGRIHATGPVAPMQDRHALRNRRYETLVRQAMGVKRSSVLAMAFRHHQNAVAFSLRSKPYPTCIGLGWLDDILPPAYQRMTCAHTHAANVPHEACPR